MSHTRTTPLGITPTTFAGLAASVMHTTIADGRLTPGARLNQLAIAEMDRLIQTSPRALLSGCPGLHL